MKEAEAEQPWTISIRGRAKRFHFKFKYSKFFKIPKFLIRLKLRPFTLEFESKPKPAFSLKQKLLGLKFLPKFKLFRRKPSGFKAIVLDVENRLCGSGRRRRNRIWLWVVVLAVILQLSSYFGARFFWQLFGMVWNSSAISGILYQFFKVIFDGLFQSLGF